MTSNAQHITIRIARPDDAQALLAIYAPYVEHTAVTFEYDVPSVEEFRDRIAAVLEKYPYLVAEDIDGTIAGYAYASAFKDRAAYDWAVELSMYIAPNYQRHKLGQTMYQALEDCLKQQNVTNLNACITYSTTEDAMHDNGSIRFHEQMGYKRVAHFHECGYKMGRWWDMVWMEKIVAPHHADQPAFMPFKGSL